jgi:AraC-like DNA-binding protein
MKLREEEKEYIPGTTYSAGEGSMAASSGRYARGPRRYHNASDEAFLVAVSGVIQQHLADPGFDTSEAAMEMSMSRMHLHRKLRTLTGYSTRRYITTRRLEEARNLLAQPTAKVNDVAGQVGFRSASYFARAFVRTFGIYPSEFARKNVGWQPPRRDGRPR